MQTCSIVAELGDAYILGALEPAETRELEEHLDKCPPCRERLEASKRSPLTGKPLCKTILRNSCPTRPVAPTTATL